MLNNEYDDGLDLSYDIDSYIELDSNIEEYIFEREYIPNMQKSKLNTNRYCYKQYVQFKLKYTYRKDDIKRFYFIVDKNH